MCAIKSLPMTYKERPIIPYHFLLLVLKDVLVIQTLLLQLLFHACKAEHSSPWQESHGPANLLWGRQVLPMHG